MGGSGTWNLAAHYPERFAAVAPICGRGMTHWTWALLKTPLWVFHGAKDDVVPIEESQRMVEALQKGGGNVKFTVYPDAGHDAWTQTYENEELYRWFLEHRRPGSPRPSGERG
jgi:predicted peptidase